MEYLSRNPSAPPQADDAYDEENVINSIIPHYKFMAKYGRLSNQLDQSQSAKLYNEPNAPVTRIRLDGKAGDHAENAKNPTKQSLT